MKPIRLTMTAFGPYKDQEIIDFTELKEHKLFVVSGNTGAGKTTLFDGICFALFGSASGEDRGEIRMMRSHFASDDVHTSVAFEFELQGRRYRLLRQLAHVKEGNKSATGEKYEFYEQTDDGEVPCVDRQMVSEINTKVQALVGLTEDQFKQIVMLPQGEFRKLLTSETDNKEAILRKIFRTEPYQWFTTRMKAKRTEAEKELSLAQDRMQQHLAHIQEAIPDRDESRLTDVFKQEHWNPDQVLDGLDSEHHHYETEAKTFKEEVDQRKKFYDKMFGDYHEAKQINAKFDQLKEKEESLKELQEKQPEMNVKQKQLEQAEKAATIAIYETYHRDAMKDKEAKTKALKQAEDQLQAAVKQREEAESRYNQEKEKQPERERTQQDLNHYQELFPIVENADRQINQLKHLNEKLKQEQSVLGENETAQNQLKQDLEQLRMVISQDEQATETLSAKKDQYKDMTETGKKFRSYLDGCEAYTVMQNDLKKTYAAYEANKKQFDRLEERWIKGQATVLARHLHDGEPCPVCGSTGHPDKAIHQDEVPTKSDFDEARALLNKAHEVYLSEKAALESKGEAIKADKMHLDAFEFTKLSEAKAQFDAYLEEARALKEEINGLNDKAERLKKKRQERETKEKELSTLTETIQERRKSLQELELKYATEQAQYDTNISRIPEDLRSLKAMEEKIQALTAKKKELDQAWDQAQKSFSDATQEETSRKTALQGAKSQLNDSETNAKKAEDQFRNEIKKAGFESEEDYRSAVMAEEMRHGLKKEIETHQSHLQSLTQQVADLNKELTGQEQKDLKAMEDELQSAEKALEEANRQWTKTSELATQIKHAMTNITEAIRNTKEKEENFQVVADLHDMIRGQNSSKISFERYIQIEFLEHIITAANQRLYRISNGQYHLVRSDRQESRGKQSGLSLDVYDAYTGQNRDVKTLSGGEKFNASLSLALGMSDVIQSYQGGVVIDTMFIDEGFGSLDEESLHKVMDTLIDLQKSGRTIGVISHVQEMKTVFPAILEVKKTPEGYSQTRFIVS
ncbi:AAA family ATPase [Salisediminibacterium beveridgei]|uniref:Nuclease SbcCD subunit C n=1 Tax=Salisediminibacterium beveridgei TaxID=632773 RepID=A0A1D7QX75_9BACI|nr:SMC family ATPase [Salisediminibacterium beveridgei]AOM83606.1 DNA repair exonuclease, SbcC subunit [Salisediminibacterium beveridgei]